MKHLSPEELIDLTEGNCQEVEAPHLRTCEGCRRRLADLRAAMRLARQVEVPEPSPLFWEHFSARVQQAVAVARAPATVRWWPAWSLSRLAAALTLVTVVVVVGAVTLRRAPHEAGIGGFPPSSTTNLIDNSEMREDPSWELMADLTQEWGWESPTEEGLTLQSGSAEGAVLHLSDAERQELGRLLKAELQRPQS